VFVALTRLVFLILATMCGHWMGSQYGTGEVPALFALTAFLFALIILIIEHNTYIISSKKLLLGGLGLLLGLIAAALVAASFPDAKSARPVCNLIFGYLGVIIALKHADRFNLSKLNFLLRPGYRGNEINIVLDTNIIIDGRLKEIVPTGFLQGNLVIPQFVLDELQRLADSGDSQRRIRGKRGLANLDYLRSIERKFELYDVDYEEIKDVDHKLIRLTSDIGGSLLTNDNNLRSIAQLQGLNVLNINDLTNAVRPVAHVGEVMRTEIIRQGKEATQGVGYLEDGTMVVVDDGVHLVGQTADIVVTSVLQTSNGRMIFSRPRAESDGDAEPSTESHSNSQAPSRSSSREASHVG
jgi:uncharacterized protein YacL